MSKTIGRELKFLDTYRRIELNYNSEDWFPRHINWHANQPASEKTYTHPQHLFRGAMDCAEPSSGYGDGQAAGNHIYAHKLEYSIGLSAYYAYGQGVLPDNAAMWYKATAVTSDSFNRATRNYATSASRVTYRVLFYCQKDEGLTHWLEPYAWDGNQDPYMETWVRGDITMEDTFRTDKPSDLNPDEQTGLFTCPYAGAMLVHNFLKDAEVLLDETYTVSSQEPTALLKGEIELERVITLSEPYRGAYELTRPEQYRRRAVKNRIMCRVVATSYNQRGEQSFESQWPVAWVNTRLHYEDH